jgi:hypothetical protein
MMAVFCAGLCFAILAWKGYRHRAIRDRLRAAQEAANAAASVHRDRAECGSFDAGGEPIQLRFHDGTNQQCVCSDGGCCRCY